MLKNHSAFFAMLSQFLALQSGDVFSMKQYLTGCDFMHAIDASQQSGFTTSAQTNNGNKFAFSNIKRDVFQCCMTIRIGLDDMLNGKQNGIHQ